MTPTDGQFRVNYTNKDIMDRLETINNNISKVRIMQARTNGKVKLHEKFLITIGSALAIIITGLIGLYF